MKKTIFLLIQLVFISTSILGQNYNGPIAKPISGYGSDGDETPVVESFTNPNFPTKDIEIYYPDGITSPVPTIFYSHAYGGNNSRNISGFLNFIAKKGYAVVYVPYQTFGVTVNDRYNNLLEGFLKAARDYPMIIDTTKVGFVGHSFGGGASFANAYDCFMNLNWGSSGRFIFTMAQWYSYNITQTELESFPNDVKLLTIVYEDDETNDLRMANDIFNSINIPPSEKDYLRVKSDIIDGYYYVADHALPNNSNYDALDYYAYFRLLDAMCDYVFNNNLTAKNIALGAGGVNQIEMPGGLQNLIHSENPSFSNPRETYTFPCDTIINPRQSYCDLTLSTEELILSKITIYPNPISSFLQVRSDKEINEIQIFNQQGKLLKAIQSKQIDMSEFSNGLYLVRVTLSDNSTFFEKILKQ